MDLRGKETRQTRSADQLMFEGYSRRQDHFFGLAQSGTFDGEFASIQGHRQGILQRNVNREFFTQIDLAGCLDADVRFTDSEVVLREIFEIRLDHVSQAGDVEGALIGQMRCVFFERYVHDHLLGCGINREANDELSYIAKQVKVQVTGNWCDDTVELFFLD